MIDRRVRKDYNNGAILFGLGLVSGALTALAFARMRPVAQRLPRLEVWQRALAETLGKGPDGWPLGNIERARVSQ